MDFTVKGIKALKATGKRYEISQTKGKGLRIRISRQGTLTFVYVFRRNGKLHRLTLGQVGDISLAAANAKHTALRKRVLAGESVQSLRALIGTVRTSGSFTVADLAKQWMEREVKKERKTWPEVQRILDKDVIPYLGERPAAAVRPREVMAMLDEIVDRGSPIAANRCASMVKQMFKFAVGRGEVDASPCVALKKPGGKEPSRKRKLTDDEIKRLWDKLDTAAISPALRAAVRLLLVTAQRRGEMARATKSEFDIEAKVWQIPAEHSKNGQPHDVPLSDLALELLGELMELAGDRDYVLPSPTVKDESIRPEALTRAISRNREHFAIAAFNVHDLRRTAASNMTAHGINRLHVAKVLNHTVDDVTETYDRHDYLDEKRAALQLWADTLRAIIKGKRKKVEPIRQALAQ